MNIPDPIAIHSNRTPERIALSGEGIELSFRQIDEKINAVAQQLRDVGVRRNDSVGFVAFSSEQSIVLFWALFRLNARAVPISHRLPDEGVSDVLGSAGCSLFVGTPLAASEIPTCVLEWDGGGEQSTPDGCFESSDFSTIVQTSGSTGTPKLAVHTFGNHFYSAWDSHARIPLLSGDAWLHTIPLNHVGGIAILFRCFLAGATIVLPAVGEAISESIVFKNITHVSLVSTQLQRLVDDYRPELVTTLKSVLCGGSAIPEPLVRLAVNLGFPIQLTYGLTEATSQVATTNVLSTESDMQFSGALLGHVSARTKDGGIELKGPTIFAGYLNGDAVVHPFDSDGWFATGDRGHIEGRKLIVNGRCDNMFISGGENIQPEEVEVAVLRTGFVLRVVVIPIPDVEYGFRPVAIVSLSKGARLEDVHSILLAKLPRFKVPVTYYRFPDDLSGVAKISRTSLLKRVVEGELEELGAS